MSKKWLKDRSEALWHEAILMVTEILKSLAKSGSRKKRRAEIDLRWHLFPIQIWIQGGSKAK